MDSAQKLRRIPAVDRLLLRPAQSALLDRFPRALVADAARAALSALREEVRAADQGACDALLAPEAVDERVREALEARLRPNLRPVLNATGVVVHTNLGRSPLGPRALEAVQRVAGGYCTLEYDLAAGRRGSRHTHVDDLFGELTGAEAALVVNNNAAAVVLILAALARDREVVVSRGELIEIGGSFRLPDIMAAGGARLREVGTTNRTRARDYEAAVGPETAMLLKAHRSNFAIVGFTESPSLPELAEVARRHDLPLVYDLGSGALAELAPFGLPEPVWAGRPLREGADLVCFSGDKLLGGPQCGIILGRRDLVLRLREHPLTRAFRVGKLTIAALEATVRCYLDGSYEVALPAVRAIATPLAELDGRAQRLASALRDVGAEGLSVEVTDGASTVGGGSLPGSELPSRLVVLALADGREAALERALRHADPPLVGRLAEGHVVLDVRTLTDEQLPDVVAAVRASLARMT